MNHINNGKNIFQASNNLFGDPHEGETKTLKIRWIENKNLDQGLEGEEYFETVDEGDDDTIKLPDFDNKDSQFTIDYEWEEAESEEPKW